MGVKVLIVDDNLDNRELLMTIFRRLKLGDLQLLEAATGIQAVELAFSEKPALILLDLMLPGLSGYEVCHLLKHHAELSRTHIIMVTAADSKAHRTQAFEAGVDDFIAKPFDIMLLRDCVRKVLEPLFSAEASQEI